MKNEPSYEDFKAMKTPTWQEAAEASKWFIELRANDKERHQRIVTLLTGMPISQNSTIGRTKYFLWETKGGQPKA